MWSNGGGCGCIKLKVDEDSMAGYRDDGFKPNFCRDNKNKWTDKATVAIEGGLLIGGLSLALFPQHHLQGLQLSYVQAVLPTVRHLCWRPIGILLTGGQMTSQDDACSHRFACFVMMTFL